MFVVRANGVLFSAGNIALLGLMAPPEVVGYFAGAEKIAGSVRQLLSPAIQTLYPRMSYLVSHERQRAVQLIRSALLALVVIGAILGSLVFVLAPLLVRILLGGEFAPAVPALRVLALLPPIVALNLILGSQWLLPLGYDRLFMLVGLKAVLLDFLLTFLVLVLVPRYAHIGAAWAIIVSQAFMAVSFFLALRNKGLGFSLTTTK